MTADALAKCPGCGLATRTDHNYHHVAGALNRHHYLCYCGWTGPEAESIEAARAAWNLRAPALVWRREPPTEPGWWWVQTRRDSQPRISQYALDACEAIRVYGSSQVAWYAGPIPEPEEGAK